MRPDKCSEVDPVRTPFDPADISKPIEWLAQPFGEFFYQKGRPIHVSGQMWNLTHGPGARFPSPLFASKRQFGDGSFGGMATMSVDQPQVIDIVSKDGEGSTILTISDHLNWENTKEHLIVLQEKINTYLAFLDSGEIYEKYPEAKGRPIKIEVMFHYQLNPEAYSFLAKIKSIVEDAGYNFRFEQFSATPFPI